MAYAAVVRWASRFPEAKPEVRLSSLRGCPDRFPEAELWPHRRLTAYHLLAHGMAQCNTRSQLSHLQPGPAACRDLSERQVRRQYLQGTLSLPRSPVPRFKARLHYQPRGRTGQRADHYVHRRSSEPQDVGALLTHPYGCEASGLGCDRKASFWGGCGTHSATLGDRKRNCCP